MDIGTRTKSAEHRPDEIQYVAQRFELLDRTRRVHRDDQPGKAVDGRVNDVAERYTRSCRNHHSAKQIRIIRPPFTYIGCRYITGTPQPFVDQRPLAGPSDCGGNVSRISAAVFFIAVILHHRPFHSGFVPKPPRGRR